MALTATMLTLSALLAWLNYRYLKLPPTIGLMALALGTSSLLIVADQVGLTGDLRERVTAALAGIDFSGLLLHGILGVLLFAGALHVDLGKLRRQWLPISALALVGTTLSTFAIGTLVYVGFGWAGLPLRFLEALLLGALISPTDPIATLGILQKSKVSETLQVQISGESMFNDGVGVVIFSLVLELATSGGHATFLGAATLFARGALGGVVLGLATGYAAFLLLRSVDDDKVEVLISLALVAGSYSLGEWLDVSSPIAAVVSGLLIGNHGRRLAMSERTRLNLDTFWELLDDIFNSMLFVLIGLEVLVVQLDATHVLAGGLLIVITLVARWSTSTLLVGTLRARVEWPRHAVLLLTWGGLRGGISVALALSLPESPMRKVLLATTYAVVVFSILVQGMSLGPLLRWLDAHDARER